MDIKQKYSIYLSAAMRWMKIIFTPLALIFLGYYGWVSLDVITEIVISSNPRFILVSVILWSSLHFIMPLLAVILFKSNSTSLSYMESLIIYTNRLPARYIPGGVWHTVTRAIDYHGAGISKKQISLYIISENLLSFIVALSLGSLILYGNYNGNLFMIITIICMVGIVLSVVARISVKFTWNSVLKAGFGRILISVFIMLIFWIIGGLSFSQYISAFDQDLYGNSLLYICGTYIFSWAIGFIAIFAPQGIGVTEIVAAKLMANTLEINVMVTLVLGFRVIILFSDLLVWSSTRMIKRPACRVINH